MQSDTPYKRAGVLGGMGPAATIRLYEEITSLTPVHRDQDHVPVLIDSSPQIPDRTDALLHEGADPLPWLLASARRLVAGGAEFLAIACNTAHAWYAPVAASVPVPVLHLIRVAAGACRQRLDEGHGVGVLSTEGTIATGLYQKALQDVGLLPLLPDAAGAAETMRAIRLVKAGGAENIRSATELAASQARQLIGQGAGAILLGCTDLSVILRDGDLPVPIVDSTVALAAEIVAISTGRTPWNLVVKTWQAG